MGAARDKAGGWMLRTVMRKHLEFVHSILRGDGLERNCLLGRLSYKSRRKADSCVYGYNIKLIR